MRKNSHIYYFLRISGLNPNLSATVLGQIPATSETVQRGGAADEAVLNTQ